MATSLIAFFNTPDYIVTGEGGWPPGSNRA